MSKNLTTEQFIEKAIKKHGSIYDYSRVNYINSQTKIIISCFMHGEFYPAPNDHLKGTGCPICGRINGGKKELKR